MKLAVLLYGQPRFWELSHESIIQETTFDGCSTDYYFHFWDKIAYDHSDTEYQLTDKDKSNIINTYKPRKYSFTNYSVLEQTCKKVFEIVQTKKKELCDFFNKNERVANTDTNDILYAYKSNNKETETIDDIINNVKKQHENKHKKRFAKSIFETTKPENLKYYLGQFVSLQEGGKLISEEYDYIFRIRTDLLFVTPDLYDNEKQYYTDKNLFYEKIHNKEKGIFCKYGDLQIWEGAYSNQQWNMPQTGQTLSHQPITVTNYSNFICNNGKVQANLRPLSEGILKPNIYNPKTQYLHMKDWYILGSGNELLLSIKNYINTIIAMIEKSKQFLITAGIDNDWSAGELVCGEVLGLHSINAAELGYEYLEKMIIPGRLLKIANKHTKQNILGREHVRVLADSDVPLKEQYKNKSSE